MSATLPPSDWPVRVALPGRHVVEASAGTGKTFTIATLHLRFVLEAGLPVGSVLVATFTEAATAELKARLRKNLARARELVGVEKAENAAERATVQVLAGVGAAGPDARADALATAARRLDRALSAFDAAPVFTLHGFCQRLLTELAFESGARFEEEVLTDTRPLLNAAVAQFAASSFGDDASPLAAAAPTGKTGWEKLRLAARLAVEHPEAGLEPDVDRDAVSKRLHQLAIPVRAAWSQERMEIEGELRSLSSGFHKVLSRKLEAHLRDLDAAIQSERWADIPAALCREAIDKKTLKARRAPEHPVFRDLEALREYAVSPAADSTIAATHAGALSARSTVAALKRADGLMGFDDMLQRVDAALDDPATGPALAAEVRARYPVAMIDEVQDTDPLQHRILERLFAGGLDAPGNARSYFSIGDPKQSIYRFRGADVGGFVEARERTAPGNRHGLARNFRTDAPMVAAAQAVFSSAGEMPFGATGIGLPAVAGHHPRRTSLGPALDLVFVNVAADETVNEKKKFKHAPKPSVERAIVRACVAEIRSLIADAPAVEGRPLVAGDIAVLCPQNKHLDWLAAALAEAGVPAVRPSGSSVFESPEAAAVADLAVAWLDPTDKPRLRRAMLGPVLGEVAERLSDPEALTAAADLARSCGRRWRRFGFAAALDEAMTTANAVGRLAGAPRGERVLTNLFHLGELLEGLAREGGLGPEALLARLREAMRRPSEADSAVGASASTELRLESDAAAVKLLTIHRSKGLEFPVVLLPFEWDGYQRPVTAPLLVRPGAGASEPEVIDLGSEEMDGRKSTEKQQQCEEKRRVLYVALTRARHQTRIFWVAPEGCEASALGRLVMETAESKELFTDKPVGSDAWRSALEAWVAAVSLEAKGDLARQGFDDASWEPAGLREARFGLPEAGARSEPPRSLALRTLDRLPPPALGSSSFSSLSRGNDSRSAAPPEATDRDREPAGTLTEVSGEAPAGPLDAMPGGTSVGLLVHAVLEEALADPAPFGDASVQAWCRQRVAELSARHAVDEAWHAPLGDGLARTLTDPLPVAGAAEPAFALLDTDPARRSIELPFVLAAGHGARPVLADAVADVLAQSAHGATREAAARLARADAAPIAGFLEGFIDLAVEHGGRWHVVDHKSNRLPTPPGGGPAYGHAAMEEAMVASMYLVQGHLYLAALHRLLQTAEPGGGAASLGDRLGGMAYLFVRGIAAGDHAAAGVYTHRPDPALVEALAEVLS